MPNTEEITQEAPKNLLYTINPFEGNFQVSINTTSVTICKPEENEPMTILSQPTDVESILITNQNGILSVEFKRG